MFRNLILYGTMAIVTSCCSLTSCFDETPTPPPAPKAPSAPDQKPEAKIVCPMEWVSPTTSFDAGEMPPSGVLPLDWTDNPGADDYHLTVITPNGAPVDYDVDGSSKDLFLENFNQTGAYQIIVTGLAADGTTLCSITMNFNMPVVTVSNPNNGGGGSEPENEGGGAGNPPPAVVVPSPTDDVPK